MIEDNNIHDIWESFQLGDKEAFAYLYTCYKDILYRYGTKLSQEDSLVKDSIQDVFIDLYLKRKKNKTNPQNLKFYLILALKRDLIKKLKQNRKLVIKESSIDFSFEPEYSIEKKIIEQEENTEISLCIKKILNQLPSKQTEVIYLRFNELLEYDEIALLLNISIESVRKQVYRAIKKIREVYKKEPFIFWIFFSPKTNY